MSLRTILATHRYACRRPPMCRRDFTIKPASGVRIAKRRGAAAEVVRINTKAAVCGLKKVKKIDR